MLLVAQAYVTMSCSLTLDLATFTISALASRSVGFGTSSVFNLL